LLETNNEPIECDLLAESLEVLSLRQGTLLQAALQGLTK
jgi:hypothetical protein